MAKIFEKIKSFFKNKIVKRASIFFGIFLGIVLIECTAFNYRSFSDRGEKLDYQYSQVSVTNAVDTGTQDKNGEELYTMKTPDMVTFVINFDEQKEVNTVYVDVDFKTDAAYHFYVDVRGYYNEESRYGSVDSWEDLEVIQGDEYTKYQLTNFNHAVSRIEMHIYNIGVIGDYQELTFSFGGIGINHKIPFHFSWARVLLITLACAVPFFFILLFIDRKEKSEKSWKKFILEGAMYIIPIAIIIGIFAFFGNFMYQFASPNEGTQISKELVDAFMKGHVYLDEQPSQALLSLSNPYDPNMRGGVSFLWDHLLYNGKYYSYYGITPVMILFLPFRLITGEYLQDAYGVLLFSIIGTIFMTMTFNEMLKKLYKDKPLPYAIKYLLFGLLFLGSGALFNLERPYFYEVSTSSAFMCMMIMLYHLVKGGVLFETDEKKYFNYHLFFASFWCALGVLARATMALYAVCHLIYLGFYFYRHHKEMDKKAIALFFSLSLAPYVVFGGIQAVYNYLRFGSFLDFGIEYSLTIADFKNMPFHFGNVLTSLYNFMFGLPIPTSNAYFMYGANIHFGGAYYFFETSSSIGLFVRMPILWLIFVLPFVQSATTKERVEHLFLRWLPCVIIPFIQVAITWQSGYATRYFSDFAWPLSFFAILLIAKQYQLSDNESVHKGFFTLLLLNLMYSAFTTACVICVYVPMLTHHYGDMYFAFTRYYYHLAHELTFWR